MYICIIVVFCIHQQHIRLTESSEGLPTTSIEANVEKVVEMSPSEVSCTLPVSKSISQTQATALFSEPTMAGNGYLHLYMHFMHV